MTHSPEPWFLDITPNGDRAEICSGEYHQHPDGWCDSHHVLAQKVLPTLEDATRIVACVNACRGIPTHILENWPATNSKAMSPEDELSNPVTIDGESYALVSPAGGVMLLTSDQRERMAAMLKSLKDIPISVLKNNPSTLEFIAAIASHLGYRVV